MTVGRGLKPYLCSLRDKCISNRLNTQNMSNTHDIFFLLQSPHKHKIKHLFPQLEFSFMKFLLFPGDRTLHLDWETLSKLSCNKRAFILLQWHMQQNLKLVMSSFLCKCTCVLFSSPQAWTLQSSLHFAALYFCYRVNNGLNLFRFWQIC